jgi:hypothetical protein
MGRHNVYLFLSVCPSVCLSVWMSHYCERNSSYISWPNWMNWHNGCAWSEDFSFHRFLQELWPFTLRLFHNIFGGMQLLLHFLTDLDETWHKARWWCLDVQEVRIFRFVDFWKSYGPLHLRLFHNLFLSTQVLLHFSTDLDETFCKSYGPLHLNFETDISCQRNSSYISRWIWMKLGTKQDDDA